MDLNNLEYVKYLQQQGAIFESIYTKHIFNCKKKKCFCHYFFSSTEISKEEELVLAKKFRNRFLYLYILSLFDQGLEKFKGDDKATIQLTLIIFCIQVLKNAPKTFILLQKMQIQNQMSLKQQFFFSYLQNLAYSNFFYLFSDNSKIPNQSLQMKLALEFSEEIEKLKDQISNYFYLSVDFYQYLINDQIQKEKILEKGILMMQEREKMQAKLLQLFQLNTGNHQTKSIAQVFSKHIDFQKKPIYWYIQQIIIKNDKNNIEWNNNQLLISSSKTGQINLFDKNSTVLHISLSESEDINTIQTKKRIGLITRVNPNIEKVFGLKKADVINKSINQLMPDTFAKNHDNFLYRFIETGELHQTSKETIELFGKLQSKFIFLIHAKFKLEFYNLNSIGVTAFLQRIYSNSHFLMFSDQGQLLESSQRFYQGCFQRHFGLNYGKKFSFLILHLQQLQSKEKIRQLDLSLLIPTLGGLIKKKTIGSNILSLFMYPKKLLGLELAKFIHMDDKNKLSGGTSSQTNTKFTFEYKLSQALSKFEFLNFGFLEIQFIYFVIETNIKNVKYHYIEIKSAHKIKQMQKIQEQFKVMLDSLSYTLDIEIIRNKTNSITSRYGFQSTMYQPYVSVGEEQQSQFESKQSIEIIQNQNELQQKNEHLSQDESDEIKEALSPSVQRNLNNQNDDQKVVNIEREESNLQSQKEEQQQQLEVNEDSKEQNNNEQQNCDNKEIAYTIFNQPSSHSVLDFRDDKNNNKYFIEYPIVYEQAEEYYDEENEIFNAQYQHQQYEYQQDLKEKQRTSNSIPTFRTNTGKSSKIVHLSEVDSKNFQSDVDQLDNQQDTFANLTLNSNRRLILPMDEEEIAQESPASQSINPVCSSSMNKLNSYFQHDKVHQDYSQTDGFNISPIPFLNNSNKQIPLHGVIASPESSNTSSRGLLLFESYSNQLLPSSSQQNLDIQQKGSTQQAIQIGQNNGMDQVVNRKLNHQSSLEKVKIEDSVVDNECQQHCRNPQIFSLISPNDDYVEGKPDLEDKNNEINNKIFFEQNELDQSPLEEQNSKSQKSKKRPNNLKVEINKNNFEIIDDIYYKANQNFEEQKVLNNNKNDKIRESYSNSNHYQLHNGSSGGFNKGQSKHFGSEYFSLKSMKTLKPGSSGKQESLPLDENGEESQSQSVSKQLNEKASYYQDESNDKEEVEKTLVRFSKVLLEKRMHLLVKRNIKIFFALVFLLFILSLIYFLVLQTRFHQQSDKYQLMIRGNAINKYTNYIMQQFAKLDINKQIQADIQNLCFTQSFDDSNNNHQQCQLFEDIDYQKLQQYYDALRKILDFTINNSEEHAYQQLLQEEALNSKFFNLNGQIYLNNQSLQYFLIGNLHLIHDYLHNQASLSYRSLQINLINQLNYINLIVDSCLQENIQSIKDSKLILLIFVGLLFTSIVLIVINMFPIKLQMYRKREKIWQVFSSISKEKCLKYSNHFQQLREQWKKQEQQQKVKSKKDQKENMGQATSAPQQQEKKQENFKVFREINTELLFQKKDLFFLIILIISFGLYPLSCLFIGQYGFNKFYLNINEINLIQSIQININSQFSIQLNRISLLLNQEQIMKINLTEFDYYSHQLNQDSEQLFNKLFNFADHFQQGNRIMLPQYKDFIINILQEDSCFYIQNNQDIVNLQQDRINDPWNKRMKYDQFIQNCFVLYQGILKKGLSYSYNFVRLKVIEINQIIDDYQQSYTLKQLVKEIYKKNQEISYSNMEILLILLNEGMEYLIDLMRLNAQYYFNQLEYYYKLIFISNIIIIMIVSTYWVLHFLMNLNKQYIREKQLLSVLMIDCLIENPYATSFLENESQNYN